MPKNLDDLTEAELAEWQYAHRDELDAEEGEPVEMEVTPQLTVTMSFRLPGEEADRIRDAANERGQTLTEFIREACRVAIGEPATVEPDVDGAEVYEALYRAGLVVRQRTAAGR